VRATAVYGGVPIAPQERLLTRQGVELLVATPGRLLDLHGRQSVSLDEIEVLVLDEADRMVDMGFAPDLRRILKLLPKDRQTLMFSATMPPELNKVASEALHQPQRLEVSPPSRPAASIEQAFYPVARHLKPELLDVVLRGIESDGVIVFTRTKRGADRLTRQLERRGHDAVVLHGDRSQSQRERALRDFKRGKVDILVATDIASRGIDIDDVSHVINYDVPLTPEDYVHRIGRTGRMNAAGDALTLVSPEERDEATAIERFIGVKVPRIKVEKFDYDQRAPAKEHGAGGRGSHGHAGREAGRTSGRSRPRSSHGTGATHGAHERGGAGLHPPGAGAEPEHGRRRRLNPTDRRSRRKM
jgi:ATP-dependent RNA helicase RhlE